MLCQQYLQFSSQLRNFLRSLVKTINHKGTRFHECLYDLLRSSAAGTLLIGLFAVDRLIVSARFD